jgi:hypothetical protein
MPRKKYSNYKKQEEIKEEYESASKEDLDKKENNLI